MFPLILTVLNRASSTTFNTLRSASIRGNIPRVEPQTLDTGLAGSGFPP